MTFREYYAEEFEEAMEKAADNRARDIAARMLADGFSIEKTVFATQLPRDVVETIACNLATE